MKTLLLILLVEVSGSLYAQGRADTLVSLELTVTGQTGTLYRRMTVADDSLITIRDSNLDPTQPYFVLTFIIKRAGQVVKRFSKRMDTDTPSEIIDTYEFLADSTRKFTKGRYRFVK